MNTAERKCKRSTINPSSESRNSAGLCFETSYYARLID